MLQYLAVIILLTENRALIREYLWPPQVRLLQEIWQSHAAGQVDAT